MSLSDAGRMSTAPTRLTARYWRSRRSAAVAGIVFAVLLLAAMVMMRLALAEDSLTSMRTDAGNRRLVTWSLQLIPFAGIAFLWFIGVVREQLGEVEDRLFSTVFLGSGLLFLAMLFAAAATSASILSLVSQPDPDAAVWAFGRDSTQTLISVYAMRMAAVFTLAVSTVGMRTAAIPRWVSFVGYATALVLLVAAGEHKWTQLVFPSWVLLVSIVILVTRPPARPGPASPDADPY